jgi:acyl carrier protein
MKIGEERAELRTTVEEWLVHWFAARAKISKSREAADANHDRLRDIDYFDAGWLTSMEVVEFVTEIEQQFGMLFSDHDLQDPRFVTIAGLAELILQHSTPTEGIE